MRYTYALWRVLGTADYACIQNGPSVELPARAVLPLRRVPFVVCISDSNADACAKKSGARGRLTRSLQKRARAVLNDIPPPPPEIFPFTAPPTQALVEHEQSWQLHLATLKSIFTHA
jgi:hypothetical protein